VALFRSGILSDQQHLGPLLAYAAGMTNVDAVTAEVRSIQPLFSVARRGAVVVACAHAAAAAAAVACARVCVCACKDIL